MSHALEWRRYCPLEPPWHVRPNLFISSTLDHYLFPRHPFHCPGSAGLRTAMKRRVSFSPCNQRARCCECLFPLFSVPHSDTPSAFFFSFIPVVFLRLASEFFCPLTNPMRPAMQALACQGDHRVPDVHSRFSLPRNRFTRDLDPSLSRAITATHFGVAPPSLFAVCASNVSLAMARRFFLHKC